MREIYKEYLHLRRSGNHEERIRTKADIARQVSQGSGQWYLDRLNYEIPAIHETYGEVASRTSDGNRFPDRREPSLAESVIGTQELESDYKELREMLLPNVRALIKVGSTSWAKNFDVRRVDKDKEDPSDLDLEVLIDEIKPFDFRHIDSLDKNLELFKNYHEQGMADYFSFGMTMEERPVSIHFMPVDTFVRNCNLDYTELTEEVRAREFRVKPKSKAPVYRQRDGFGQVYEFRATPRKLDESQVTETPVMMIGDKGQLVMGLIMDKYFAYPQVEGDEDIFKDNIQKFKRSVAQRLLIDGGSFSNMPSRRDRMPYWLLNQLDEEQKLYE